MVPSHTRKHNKLYRYYVCSHAQKNGWSTCPSKSVPAAQIERIVVDRVRRLGAEPDLLVKAISGGAHQTEKESSPEEAALILSALDPNWTSRPPHDQARLMHLLIERVDYDGSKGKLSIHFHPAAIQALAEKLAAQQHEEITL